MVATVRRARQVLAVSPVNEARRESAVSKDFKGLRVIAASKATLDCKGRLDRWDLRVSEGRQVRLVQTVRKGRWVPPVSAEKLGRQVRKARKA